MNIKCKTTRDEIANMSEATATLVPRKKILKPVEYKAICDFVLSYRGLIIECELEMLLKQFTNIDRQTLKSITQTELGQRTRAQHWRQTSSGSKYLENFEQRAANNWDTNNLVKISVEENIMPVALCRSILQEKYLKNKTELTRALKYPSLIGDVKLSANVIQCLCSDSQDGPLLDLKRRVLGEEFEFKLKEKAIAAGLHFYDESDLRRLGYDKTPDIKLTLPFLFKDEVVNWIESKACFGDPSTHKKYLNQQLNSYTNRFGPGIVIYWFGYRTDTPEMPENSVGITVLDDFPKVEDMEFLNLDKN